MSEDFIKLDIKSATAKDLFFDRAKVLAEIDRQTAKVLSRFGGFVRKTARRSIRRRKKVSEPGQPPSAHSDEIKNILYYYDRFRQSIIIGPVGLNSSPYGGVTVPQLLEEGGDVTTQFWLGKKTKKRGKPAEITWLNPNKVTGHINKAIYFHASDAPKVKAHYEARPFMQPAFDEWLEKLDEFWASSISRRAA